LKLETQRHYEDYAHELLIALPDRRNVNCQEFYQMTLKIMSMIETRSLRSLSFEAINLISDGDFSKICRWIACCPNLETLSMNKQYALGTSLIGDFGLIKLAECIDALTSLKKLSFFLYQTKISDDSLVRFSKALGRRIDIRSLHLSFQFCTSLTDKGFSALCLAIFRLRRLDKLYLNVAWCKRITDEGLANLKEPLRQMKPECEILIECAGTGVTRRGVAELKEANFRASVSYF